ncbi:MAG: ArnT family glycosyltransferase [Promethearchaeota archaeon]
MGKIVIDGYNPYTFSYPYNWNSSKYPPLQFIIYALSIILFGHNIFAIKMVAFLYDLGILYLVYKIAYLLRGSFSAKISFLIFSLFPFDYYTVLYGANDAIMLFFMLASVYYIVRDKLEWSAVFLALGFMQKYLAILMLIPVLIKIYSDFLSKVSGYRSRTDKPKNLDAKSHYLMLIKPMSIYLGVIIGVCLVLLLPSLINNPMDYFGSILTYLSGTNDAASYAIAIPWLYQTKITIMGIITLSLNYIIMVILGVILILYLITGSRIKRYNNISLIYTSIWIYSIYNLFSGNFVPRNFYWYLPMIIIGLSISTTNFLEWKIKRENNLRLLEISGEDIEDDGDSAKYAKSVNSDANSDANNNMRATTEFHLENQELSYIFNFLKISFKGIVLYILLSALVGVCLIIYAFVRYNFSILNNPMDLIYLNWMITPESTLLTREINLVVFTLLTALFIIFIVSIRKLFMTKYIVLLIFLMFYLINPFFYFFGFYLFYYMGYYVQFLQNGHPSAFIISVLSISLGLLAEVYVLIISIKDSKENESYYKESSKGLIHLENGLGISAIPSAEEEDAGIITKDYQELAVLGDHDITKMQYITKIKTLKRILSNFIFNPKILEVATVETINLRTHMKQTLKKEKVNEAPVTVDNSLRYNLSIALKYMKLILIPLIIILPLLIFPLNYIDHRGGSYLASLILQGKNPYNPANIDISYLYSGWINRYPPLFFVFNSIPVLFSGQNYTISIHVFKLYYVFFALLSVIYIYKISTLYLSPKKAYFIILFYSLTPNFFYIVGLVGLEEGITLFFMTSGIYYYLKDNYKLSTVLLTLGFLDSVNPIFILAIFLIYEYTRRNYSRIIKMVLILVILTICAYLPFFLDDPQSIINSIVNIISTQTSMNFTSYMFPDIFNLVLFTMPIFGGIQFTVGLVYVIILLIFVFLYPYIISKKVSFKSRFISRTPNKVRKPLHNKRGASNVPIKNEKEIDKHLLLNAILLYFVAAPIIFRSAHFRLIFWAIPFILIYLFNSKIGNTNSFLLKVEKSIIWLFFYEVFVVISITIYLLIVPLDPSNLGNYYHKMFSIFMVSFIIWTVIIIGNEISDYFASKDILKNNKMGAITGKTILKRNRYYYFFILYLVLANISMYITFDITLEHTNPILGYLVPPIYIIVFIFWLIVFYKLRSPDEMGGMF